MLFAARAHLVRFACATARRGFARCTRRVCRPRPREAAINELERQWEASKRDAERAGRRLTIVQFTESFNEAARKRRKGEDGEAISADVTAGGDAAGGDAGQQEAGNAARNRGGAAPPQRDVEGDSGSGAGVQPAGRLTVTTTQQDAQAMATGGAASPVAAGGRRQRTPNRRYNGSSAVASAVPVHGQGRGRGRAGGGVQMHGVPSRRGEFGGCTNTTAGLAPGGRNDAQERGTGYAGRRDFDEAFFGGGRGGEADIFAGDTVPVAERMAGA